MLRVLRAYRLRTVDIIWCAAVIALTMLMLLLFRTRILGGGESAPSTPPPAAVMSADGLNDWCTGVFEFRAGRNKEAAAAFHRATAAIVPIPDHELVVDPSLALWKTLAAHRDDNLKELVAGWKLAKLPPEAEVWRNIALAAAYLTEIDLKAADRELTAALRRAPDNPVVHYYIAVLRLEEAATAPIWPDAEGPNKTRFVSARLPEVGPHTKAALRLAAAEELEHAVAAADRVNLYAPLVAANDTLEPALRPLVGDVLFAIRAEHFHATAHHTLGHLLIESSALERAEHHLDKATRLGTDVLDGYDKLSEMYAAEGRPLDAVRADLKSAHKGPVNLPTLRTAWRHFDAAVGELVLDALAGFVR